METIEHVFVRAINRKINGLKLKAGQVNEKLKKSFISAEPYSKCIECGIPLTETEVYGEWDDYCIDCYVEESSNEK